MSKFLSRSRSFLASNWWFFFALVTIVVFFYKIGIGILLCFVFVGLVVVITLYKRSGKAKISKNLIGIDKITERELARISGAYIEKVHSFLHDVSRNPESSGVAILIKGEYIYFSNKIIKQFKINYRDGMHIKEMVAEMPEIETREEYKKIVEKLKDFDELPKRLKVKEEEA
ncbi:MAG: hypothetical protein ACTSUE_23400 [Promethearchaeota archaeon]